MKLTLATRWVEMSSLNLFWLKLRFCHCLDLYSPLGHWVGWLHRECVWHEHVGGQSHRQHLRHLGIQAGFVLAGLTEHWQAHTQNMTSQPHGTFNSLFTHQFIEAWKNPHKPLSFNFNSSLWTVYSWMTPHLSWWVEVERSAHQATSAVYAATRAFGAPTLLWFLCAGSSSWVGSLAGRGLTSDTPASPGLAPQNVTSVTQFKRQA